MLPDFFHGKAMEPPKDASHMQAFFSKLPAFLAEFPNDKVRRPAGGLQGAKRSAGLTSCAHASAPQPVTRVGVEGCKALHVGLCASTSETCVHGRMQDQYVGVSGR